MFQFKAKFGLEDVQNGIVKWTEDGHNSYVSLARWTMKISSIFSIHRIINHIQVVSQRKSHPDFHITISVCLLANPAALLCSVLFSLCWLLIYIYSFNSHRQKIFERRTYSVRDEIGVYAVRNLTIRSVIWALRQSLICRTRERERKNQNVNQNTNTFISVVRNPTNARRVFFTREITTNLMGIGCCGN